MRSEIISSLLISSGMCRMGFTLAQRFPQSLPSDRSVLMLGALLGGCDHRPRGQVGESDGRVGLVAVLSASARGAEGVHADVLLAEFEGMA